MSKKNIVQDELSNWCQGFIKIKLYKDKKLTDIIRQDNLVVNSAKLILAGLMVDDPSYTINLLKIGTSQSTPTKTNIDLITPVYQKDITLTTFDEPTNTAYYRFIVGLDEMPSSSYFEFGLFSSTSNKMFSRVTINPSGFFYDRNSSSFEVEWGLRFLS